jgi:acyl-coenzyme A thioesterase PaaI-like protein
MIRHLSWYPPYIGAGVLATAQLERNRYLVRMPLRWFNRNIFGTHFGGSLFSMCDPFFALVVQEKLGDGYEVWMKEASIEYLRPGRGTVSGVFEVDEERLTAIRRAVESRGRDNPEFDIEIRDEAGRTIVRVHQRLHVRPSSPAQQPDEARGVGA